MGARGEWRTGQMDKKKMERKQRQKVAGAPFVIRARKHDSALGKGNEREREREKEREREVETATPSFRNPLSNSLPVIPSLRVPLPFESFHHQAYVHLRVHRVRVYPLRTRLAKRN